MSSSSPGLQESDCFCHFYFLTELLRESNKNFCVLVDEEESDQKLIKSWIEVVLGCHFE